MEERQPGGRFVYEYDRAPYPPVTATSNVSLSPGNRLAEETVKVVIEGSDPTVKSVEALVVVPRVSVTVHDNATAPGVPYVWLNIAPVPVAPSPNAQE